MSDPKFVIVESYDGLQLVPYCWLTDDKKHSYWPPYKATKRFATAVQNLEEWEESWSLFHVKRIIGTSKTYKRGRIKLEEAQFLHDVHSENKEHNESEIRKIISPTTLEKSVLKNSTRTSDKMFKRRKLHANEISRRYRRKLVKEESDTIIQLFEENTSCDEINIPETSTTDDENVQGSVTISDVSDYASLSSVSSLLPVTSEVSDIINENINSDNTDVDDGHGINNLYGNEFAEECKNDESQDNGNENLNSFLRTWALQERISHKSLKLLLQGIKKHTCQMCHNNLPSDPRSLLQTPRITTLKALSVGQYYHFGLRRGIEKYSITLDEGQEIKLTVNVDGVPLSKSSHQQFWPILASIKPYSTVFAIGIYYGVEKPKDSNEYLEDFVKEAKDICQNGIIINDVRVPCAIDSIVCDAPAKAFVLQVKNHTGYNSCTKCKTDGNYTNGRVCFPQINASLRTDKDFTDETDEDFHTGSTILKEIPNLGLVSNVPLDYMHLVCLGVMRKLINLWLAGDLNFRISHRMANQISDCLIRAKFSIPIEFARKPRGLQDVKLWKATEFRQLLLYTGPLVLKSSLKLNLYRHFLVLHVAIRILCSPNLTILLDYAQRLLEHFVSCFDILYGVHNISHNVHGLVHLVQDVKKFGCLDHFSAFNFENHLQTFKKLLRKPNQPLQQICRRFEEIENMMNTSHKKNLQYILLFK